MREIDQRLAEIEAEREQQRVARLKADREFNKAFAEEKRQKEIAAKLQETFQNMNEIQTVSNGDFLSENPAVGIRQENPNR